MLPFPGSDDLVPNVRESRSVACLYVYPGTLGDVDIIKVLAERLGLKGYKLVLHVFRTHQELLTALNDADGTGNYDAVVLWGSEPEVEERALLLEQQGVPFVVKGRFESNHPNWLQIDFDHEGMMARAVQFLADLGHRRIAYIGHNNSAVYSHKLIQGFQDAMNQRLSQDVPHQLILRIGERSEKRLLIEQGITRWLAMPAGEQPTALVMGIPGGAWRDVEISLAGHGKKMGYASDDMAVAGLDCVYRPLLFGEAHTFPGIDFAHLAEALQEQLLLPVLRGEQPVQNIVRISPALERIGPLGAGDYETYLAYVHTNIQSAARRSSPNFANPGLSNSK